MKSSPKKIFNKSKLRAWLKSHGHGAAVDSAKLDTPAEAREYLFALHGIKYGGSK